MANPQSSLIIKHWDSFGGNFIDSDYLAAAYETGKPHYLPGALMKIYSSGSQFFKVKPFLNLVGMGTNGGTEVETEIVRWRLQGAEYKCARVIENVEASNTTPGINNTQFRVKLDLDYYAYPDVLVPEDNDYNIQVVDKVSDGTGTIYTLKLITDDPTKYLDPQYLAAGREWCKVSTAVPSEMNQWFGTQQYPSIFELEAQLGAFGQKIDVTDKAWRQQGRLGFEFMSTDYNGRTSTVNKFLPYAEAMMVDELYKSMEWALVYGEKSTMAGPDGYWQKTGAGIRQQLKDSWIQYVNGPLTVNLLQDFLLNIFFGRTDEANRGITLMTGQLGSLIFHNALAAVANGFLTVDSNYIRKENNPNSGTPGLSFGAQFVRYTGPLGIDIRLVHNPLYDDLRYCKRMHPQYPNIPIDSARMTFLNIEGRGVETAQGIGKNIELLKVKDTFRYFYVPGSITPMGPITNKGMAVTAKAGYTVAIEGTIGAIIRDVTSCGELITDYDN